MPQIPTNSDIRARWSYTRSSLLRKCPRAFYYDQTREADDAVRKAFSLHALVGLSVHTAIASEISSWASGDQVYPEKAEACATRNLEEVWTHRDGMIVEVVNGMELPDGTYERMLRATRTLLRTFFRMIWPNFSNQSYVTHERLDSFDLDGVIVLVQVDLATRNGAGDFIISDWKTGLTLDPYLEELQMGTYALWAHVGLGENINRILTQVVNLRSGQILRRRPDRGLLGRIRSQIETDVRKTSPPLTVTGFPPEPAFEKCCGCRFLRICEDGQLVVGERSDFDSLPSQV